MENENRIAAAAATKRMTVENFTVYLQKLAERLDSATRDIDPWYYGGEITTENGVDICKNTLINEPYVVVEFLLNALDTFMD